MSNLKLAHSWVYPQSSLPPSVISALSLAAEGGKIDFLSKRQFAWERTPFEVFVTCSERMCATYSMDIFFSMPLSHSKVEQVTTEDLAELSEIERHNLGQTRRLGSISDEDNSPKSFLAIRGNESVHGLYDFLLNYRFIMTSMTGVDVPVLYAPLPFENADLSAPEVICKEVRRADHMPVPLEKKMPGELNKASASGFCYSIEIKDSYLPPWVISSICSCLDSDESSYDISFLTEPTSTGLNVGLKDASQKYNAEVTDKEFFLVTSFSYGVPNSIMSPQLDSAFLKGLKYCTVSLSPV